MKLLNDFLIILVCYTLTACDCHYQISGIVLDEATRMPLSDVAIGTTINAGNSTSQQAISAENGAFDLKGTSDVCDNISFYFVKSNYVVTRSTIANGDTVYLKFKGPRYFDAQQDFKVTNIATPHDYPASRDLLPICESWTLTEADITTLIKGVKRLEEGQLHYAFDHFPCRITATLVQRGQTHELSINGGGWWTIASLDSVFEYGNYKEELDRYFGGNAEE